MIKMKGKSYYRANFAIFSSVGQIEFFIPLISFAYSSLHALLKNCTDLHGLKLS